MIKIFSIVVARCLASSDPMRMQFPSNISISTASDPEIFIIRRDCARWIPQPSNGEFLTICRLTISFIGKAIWKRPGPNQVSTFSCLISTVWMRKTTRTNRRKINTITGTHSNLVASMITKAKIRIGPKITKGKVLTCICRY